MQPYEGPKQYAFVSYSHKDFPQIEPFLKGLHDLGCRFWYDAGINPGAEWPEYVANKLGKCGLVILFISANSMKSENVRSEIAYARSKRIPFLCLHLDDSPPSPGIELQLGLFQHVFHGIHSKFRQTMQEIQRCSQIRECMDLSVDKVASPESVTVFFEGDGYRYAMRLLSPDSNWGTLRPILRIEQLDVANGHITQLLEMNGSEGSQLFEDICIQAVRRERAGVFDDTDHDRLTFELQFIREHIDFDIGIGERAHHREAYEIIHPFSPGAECKPLPSGGKTQTIQQGWQS